MWRYSSSPFSFTTSWYGLKNTKAWALFKGVVLIMVFIILAAVFEMNTILWIARNVVMYGAVALVVVLQPELRKALEQLGKRNFWHPCCL